jgi:S-methylmethionine-dependent homocysteine/selenocysteine methylase
VSARVTILDGPTGSELTLRGAPTRERGWSANAITRAPDLLREVHAAYAAAGATVHTACTFRAQPRLYPQEFRELVHAAVTLAREGTRGGEGARIAGSLAPVGDCYAPDESPPPDVSRRLHAEMAGALAEAGVDLILCETFPSAAEAEIAVEAASATGLPVWIALTAGPGADLLTPPALAEAARRCVERGACAALVCCVGASLTLPYVEALAAIGAPFGAYANAGAAPGDAYGADDAESVARYVMHASTWVAAGATLVGSCCGTRPAHVRALSSAFR